MAKLSIEDLDKIKEKVQREMSLREGKYRAKVNVHMGTCGIAAGARKIMEVILDEIAKRDVKDVVVTSSGCAGLCSKEPMMTVEIPGHAPVKYIELDEKKTREIFEKHVLGGEIVEKYALAVGSENVG